MSLVEISSRLLPAVTVGKATLSVNPTGETDSDGKPEWYWFVDLPCGHSQEGSELFGWCNAAGTLSDLCGFLAHYAEDCESQTTFDDEVIAWARRERDELSIMAEELESEEEANHE